MRLGVCCFEVAGSYRVCDIISIYIIVLEVDAVGKIPYGAYLLKDMDSQYKKTSYCDIITITFSVEEMLMPTFFEVLI
jgi:hypothetical protein